MSRETYVDRVVRERWDDNTRTYTAYDDKGVQTESRPYNTEEGRDADARIAARGQLTNRATIQQQAQQALATNRAFVASTPTAAQTTAQVKALARQNNGIIRLLLNDLTGTD